MLVKRIEIVEATTAFIDATKETVIPPELPFDPGSLEVDIDTMKELAKKDDLSPIEEIFYFFYFAPY